MESLKKLLEASHEATKRTLARLNPLQKLIEDREERQAANEVARIKAQKSYDERKLVNLKASLAQARLALSKLPARESQLKSKVSELERAITQTNKRLEDYHGSAN